MQTRQIDLILNKLLKAQYEGTTPNADELYLATDDAGITSADVINALGYTPYNGTANPNGYIGSAQLGDATITIQQDGEAQNFTTNQTTNQTINIKGLYDYYNLNEIRVIGSPTINNGVVSDIDTNNFVMHSCKFPTSWELELTFSVIYTPGQKDDEVQYIIGDGNVPPNLAIRIDGDYAGMTEDSLSVCVNGTWYGLSSAALYGSETYQLILSTYGQADSSHSIGTYLYVYSITSDEVIYDGLVTSNVLPPTASNFSDNIYFGFSNQGTPLDGSVDLTETYLRTINNGQTTLVWTGATVAIDSKANADLSNVPTSKGILTETYINGQSWYRVYSDGWCEQGGFYNTTALTGTISLIKTYANTDYSVSLTSKYSTSAYAPCVSAVTTSSFSYYVPSTNVDLYWQACGYSA